MAKKQAIANKGRGEGGLPLNLPLYFYARWKSFTNLLLHGDCRYDSKTHQSIIISDSIKFIILVSVLMDGVMKETKCDVMNVMKETKNLLALFRFQCLPNYINKPDNEALPQCVNNVLVFFKFSIIVNCFVCWYHCNI